MSGCTRFQGLCRGLLLLPLVFVSGCDSIVERVANGPAAVLDDQSDHCASDQPRDDCDLFVVDLHADTLLWNRDILTQNTFRGDVDLPRLLQGGIDLQNFTVVTQYPWVPWSSVTDDGRDCVSSRGMDGVAWLSLFQGRFLADGFSRKRRALYQADRLERFAEDSRQRHQADPTEPELMIVRYREDLDALRDRIENGEPVVGALLGLEGVHWLGDVDLSAQEIAAEVEELYRAGFRTIALTHRFDNGLAYSSEGCASKTDRDGLSEQGKQVLKAAQDLNMIIDVAHASSRSIEAMYTTSGNAVAAPVTQAVIMSHGGVQGSCEKRCKRWRNLSDEDVRTIARNGGVVGIGLWPAAVGDGIASTIDAMLYVETLLRSDPDVRDPCAHISLGSDFDGAVRTSVSSNQMQLLIDEMRRIGSAGAPDSCISESRLADILGENAFRLIRAQLPACADDEAVVSSGPTRRYCPGAG